MAGDGFALCALCASVGVMWLREAGSWLSRKRA